ncbi:conserved hypothetical protein [Pediculus humanus corporis]|uniref:C1q domain-containing protein n=1 Tax=Pediculus humanus subsp. corporis TaxID=121224 RepID=E0VLW8_PEDHC|nr:uncharacterized protein Phum_PHUM294830 [Pediculus humanus corporis]EEB14374.1 conserved hypothetical protein [Pediculus humanus corporis]
MQLLWFLVGLLVVVVVNAAVPEGPRIEGSKRLTQTVDCNGAVVFSAVSTPETTSPASSDKNQIINFDTSLIDKSVGFGRESGIFTTHCPGLYQFTFTATGDASSRFSFRKRPSASTTAWKTIAVTNKTGGSHILFIDMEVGEQAAIFVDAGSLSPATSHSFSGYRVSKKL